MKKEPEEEKWIKDTKDDPCDPMMPPEPMSKPGDKDYEC